MKHILLFLLLTSAYAMNAQMNVSLHMDQKLGDDPFSYNEVVQGSMGYYFKMTRLQYYISEIKLHHDGGQITTIPEFYFLVDPALNTDFELGSFQLTDLEQISFSVGVDAAHNHLDPSSYAAGHPLAPQNPSMHWGWTPGYRFIASEGLAGADSNAVNNTFQIHTIGDANYRSVTLDVHNMPSGDQLTVHIEADYIALMNEINASSGVTSHASTGPSKQLADNVRFVFSTSETTSIGDPVSAGKFDVSPNPSEGIFFLNYDFPDADDLTFMIHDMAGHLIMNLQPGNTRGTVTINTITQPGLYMVSTLNGHKKLGVQKLVIH